MSLCILFYYQQLCCMYIFLFFLGDFDYFHKKIINEEIMRLHTSQLSHILLHSYSLYIIIFVEKYTLLRVIIKF